MDRSPEWMFETMRRFYAESPACLKAAKPIKEGASSLVMFEGDDRPYALVREKGVSVLRPGRPEDPDMFFRFTAGAVEALASLRTRSVGEYATRIFDLILSEDPRCRVDYRLFSDFATLFRRGYVGILLLGGPAVLAYGARHGVKGIGGLKRLIASVMSGSSEAVVEGLKTTPRPESPFLPSLKLK